MEQIYEILFICVHVNILQGNVTLMQTYNAVSPHTFKRTHHSLS